MYILGISAFYHDSAAALLRDGEIIAAAQEERFTRKKHDPGFPSEAIEYCLGEAGITPEELDVVAFYDKPFLKFERIMETYLAYAPSGLGSFLKAVPLWIKQKLWTKDLIKRELGYHGRVVFPEHHESHAASAFFPSPFTEAAFLTTDGVGEWATTSFGVGSGNRVKILSEMRFPHSLGLLYSAFTYYTGFKVNSGEYKVMGLAPYGEPRYKDLILDKLMDLKEDGSFKFRMEYFNYCAGLTMTSKKFHELFGGPPRRPETKLTQREMDLARSVQEAAEEIIMRIARHVHASTGKKNLCLAGGVAMNCVANGKLLKEGPFEDIWIQPAAGDAGGALGAAFFAWHQCLEKPRRADGRTDSMKGGYLGPEFGGSEIRAFLDTTGTPYSELSRGEVPGKVADLIAGGDVVGWFQGRMEFGPRALGARSILGDPRSADMQETMNLKIKFRESFRPFAPSVLEERAGEYFEIDRPSPYMLLVVPVSPGVRKDPSPDQAEKKGLEKLGMVRSTIPAVTHVDSTARIQTVSRDTNPLYYDMIKELQKRHGCPVVINTSFNVRGEPIVCTPEDAYRCFVNTNMDYLVMGDFLLEKTEEIELDKDPEWLKEFELD